jgi:outer membrane beta-barrel protein
MLRLRTLSALAIALLLGAPIDALAAKKKKKKADQQTEQSEEQPKSDSSADEILKSDDKGAASSANNAEPLKPAEVKPASDTAKAPDKPVKGPFARIADDEETIYAVQRKAYLVNHKIELTPFIAGSFTDRFVTTFAPAGSVTYHIAENFGIEAFGAYFFPSESGLTTELLDKGQLTPELAKLTQMLWAAGLGFTWSPIYGKIQIFGSSLGNFNFYIGAGAGVGQTRVQCRVPGEMLDPNRGFSPNTCPMPFVDPMNPTVVHPVYEPATLHAMGAVSGGAIFYFSNRIGLRLEVKDWVFTARTYRPESTDPMQRFTDAVRNNVFAQLGISFLLGGEE